MSVMVSPPASTHALLVFKFISCHFTTNLREKEIELHITMRRSFTFKLQFNIYE